MSYNIHITRASSWFESNQHPIQLEEWVQVVEADSEMELQSQAHVTTPSGLTLTIEGEPGFAVWHSSEGDVFFDFREGRITVGRADEEVISKMVAIAKHLHAYVVGDEDETYWE